MPLVWSRERSSTESTLTINNAIDTDRRIIASPETGYRPRLENNR